MDAASERLPLHVVTKSPEENVIPHPGNDADAQDKENSFFVAVPTDCEEERWLRNDPNLLKTFASVRFV